MCWRSCGGWTVDSRQQENPLDTQITTPRGLITIRPAQAADVQAFRALRLEALHNHPEVFTYFPLPHGRGLGTKAGRI